MIEPFKTRTPVGQNGQVFSLTNAISNYYQIATSGIARMSKLRGYSMGSFGVCVINMHLLGELGGSHHNFF